MCRPWLIVVNVSSSIRLSRNEAMSRQVSLNGSTSRLHLQSTPYLLLPWISRQNQQFTPFRSRRGIHCASTSSATPVSRCCTCRGIHCASTSSCTPAFRRCTRRGIHCASADFNANCVIVTCTECSISSKCASSFHGCSHREFPSS